MTQNRMIVIKLSGFERNDKERSCILHEYEYSQRKGPIVHW